MPFPYDRFLGDQLMQLSCSHNASRKSQGADNQCQCGGYQREGG